MPKLPSNLSKVKNAQRVYNNAAERYKGLSQSAKKAGNASEARMYSKAASRMSYRSREIGTAIKQDKLSSVSDIVASSSKYKASVTGRTARGNALGEALLSGTNAGHRFFAITKDIWQGSGDRYGALADYFGTNNLSEMISMLQEETGLDILAGNINMDTDSLGGMSQTELIQAMEALMYE